MEKVNLADLDPNAIRVHAAHSAFLKPFFVSIVDNGLRISYSWHTTRSAAHSAASRLRRRLRACD